MREAMQAELYRTEQNSQRHSGTSFYQQHKHSTLWSAMGINAHNHVIWAVKMTKVWTGASDADGVWTVLSKAPLDFLFNTISWKQSYYFQDHSLA